jgi:diamine N-acetyltransferase
MIDRYHQRQGHARQAIALLLGLLRDAGYRGLKTSTVLGPGGPLDFYRSLGFDETGSTTTNGERILMRPIAD